MTVYFFSTSLNFLLQMYFSTERSLSSGDGCLSTGLERPASLRLSTCCSSSPGPRQAPFLQGHGTHSNRTVLASEGVVSGPFESVDRPPVVLPKHRDLLRQPHFHHLHQHLHVLQLHAWRLYSDSSGM